MPRVPQGASQITLDAASLAVLLDGVDLRAVRSRRRARARAPSGRSKAIASRVQPSSLLSPSTAKTCARTSAHLTLSGKIRTTVERQC